MVSCTVSYVLRRPVVNMPFELASDSRLAAFVQCALGKSGQSMWNCFRLDTSLSLFLLLRREKMKQFNGNSRK